MSCIFQIKVKFKSVSYHLILDTLCNIFVRFCLDSCKNLSQVTFPEQVKWLVIEFDEQCGTAQNEDALQLYVPANRSSQKQTNNDNHCSKIADTADRDNWWPVLRSFSGRNSWPSISVVLPGKNKKYCVIGYIFKIF